MTHGCAVHVVQAAFEDVDFCVRAVKLGLAINYDSEAVVRHHFDYSTTGLFRYASLQIVGDIQIVFLHHLKMDMLRNVFIQSKFKGSR